MNSSEANRPERERGTSAVQARTGNQRPLRCSISATNPEQAMTLAPSRIKPVRNRAPAASMNVKSHRSRQTLSGVLRASAAG